MSIKIPGLDLQECVDNSAGHICPLHPAPGHLGSEYLYPGVKLIYDDTWSKLEWVRDLHQLIQDEIDRLSELRRETDAQLTSYSDGINFIICHGNQLWDKNHPKEPTDNGEQTPKEGSTEPPENLHDEGVRTDLNLGGSRSSG